ncbi:MAG: DUF72 domain-containing protein [Spirochaetota bacterium]
MTAPSTGAHSTTRILIGTSGYSYDDWVGPFYPPHLPKSAWLEHYAGHFSFTEINFSYYRMPRPGHLERMRERVPGDFTFSVKAHKSLTHEIDATWRAAAAAFRDAVAPLTESAQLGGVLLQFPYSFHYTPANRRYLDDLCRELETLPRFLEFRNREWQRESVYAHMRDRGIGLVVTDLPPLKGLPAPESLSTSTAAYLRFHGRNTAQWWDGDNRSRYDYLYREDELEPWVERINDLMTQVAMIMVAFNNHADGQAVANAKDLQRLLGIGR